MTIKEIAKLAGVSISTVSKVVNGKDSAISAETREKVLRVVKEYGYSAYSCMKPAAPVRTFLIGVLTSGGDLGKAFLDGAVEEAFRSGYQVVVCTSRSREDELRNISALCSQKVDGVIWQRFGRDSASAARYFQSAGIPVLTCDLWEAPGPANIPLPYAAMAGAGTRLLLEQGHTRVGCLAPVGAPEPEAFREGYRRALFERQIQLDGRLCAPWSARFNLSDLFACGATAALCFNERIAAEVYRQARACRTAIPGSLSVVCVSDEDACLGLIPAVTRIPRPQKELGGYLCAALVDLIEGREAGRGGSPPQGRVVPGLSVGRPAGALRAKIVVVGNINMDTIVNVPCLPKAGRTALAESVAQIPGGKGANQAVGAGRLGADTYLIGRVGKDHEAVQLFNSLTDSGVHAGGVKSDPLCATGKAFIHVQEGGESSIVVYPGANANVTRQDILDNAGAFTGAAYCLLQTETPVAIVEFAARLAVENGAKVILKPSAVQEISDALLADTEILLPNEDELNILCPGTEPLEEKAERFLSRGAEMVLVTLAHRGCCLCARGGRRAYYPALDCEPVDTTGAADAFAAALAVYLADGSDIGSAIAYATVAAGLSTLRQGVQPAMVTRQTLETYSQAAEAIEAAAVNGKGGESLALR